MATFVLIHGAWEAGWVWRETAAHLRAAGHEVFAPSLTGLGERAHLAAPDVDLETHIADVLGVLQWERLANVTLVGHSYGGVVVTGVADRAHERIGSLIYLDAFVPGDGQALTDLIPPERAAGMRRMAKAEGEGWSLPLAAAPVGHVSDPEVTSLLQALCVAQPFAAMTQKLDLSGDIEKVDKKAFVLAASYQRSPFRRFAEQARERGWPVEELPTHHFTMLSMPRETADMLARYAA